jgi:hypothetical protein
MKFFKMRFDWPQRQNLSKKADYIILREFKTDKTISKLAADTQNKLRYKECLTKVPQQSQHQT